MLKFDYKVMFFRVATVAYTGFLATFCKDYMANQDLMAAVKDGLHYALAGLFGGFGLDQLIFHYTKNNSN